MAMPAQVDDANVDVRVVVAPLMEVESAICGIVGPSGRRDDGGFASLVLEHHADLAGRLRGFWDDGITEWLELFVLLERTGQTLCPDPAEVLSQLPTIAKDGFKVPALPSEDAGTREVVQARIDRLSGSREVREEYASILLDLWEVAREEWEASGRDSAEAFGGELDARLRTGESLSRILPPKHLALGDAFRGLIDGSVPVVITPLSLNVSLKYILQVKGGAVYVGFGPNAEKTAEVRTRRLEEISAAFKVFSDPTRLGILQYILALPASVSDLARVLDVSQPTISAHVKILREAGLLTSSRKGTHTLYRADRNAVQALIDRGATGLDDR